MLFLGEYAGRKGYLYSEMNQLIQNFKKPVDRKNNPDEWWYKEHAISEIAKLIVKTSGWNEIQQCTWIPIPSSKTKSHPLYDDRLIQVLKKMNDSSGRLDFREMLVSLNNWEAAHE